MKNFFKNIITVIIISFILQYGWEYLQCGIFFNMNTNSPFMLIAVFSDVAITLFLYAILAIVNKDWNWLSKSLDTKDYTIIILYALLTSFYFEINAISTGRWSYSGNMPILLNTGIGIVPVLQLLILLPVTFIVSKKLSIMIKM